MMTLGVIGRCNIDDLSQIKKQIEEIPGFRVVFFKTASGRLWVQDRGETMSDVLVYKNHVGNGSRTNEQFTVGHLLVAAVRYRYGSSVQNDGVIIDGKFY